MATVIERDRPSGVLVDRSDSGAGWAVAAVIIIAILAVAAFAWARYYSNPAQPANTGPSVNVSLPSDTTGGTGSGSTGSTGGTPAPSGGTAPAY